MTQKVSRIARLGLLPAGDRALLRGLVGAALVTLLVGIAFGALTAFVRAGFIEVQPESGYAFLTLHGATIFFYWLYFAQAAVMLVFAAVYTEGVERIALAPLAWMGFVLMMAGFTANQLGTFAGAPLLYDASPEIVGDDKFAASVFYAGYLLLAIGLFSLAAAAIATALAPRFAGATAGWSAIGFGTVAWAGLVMVSSLASINAFSPAMAWSLGWRELPADHSTGWHILFHNLHYLPLMGTVLIWYVVVRETTGIGSILGDRFSKIVFALYMIFVPPTSLYHMFLEPGLSPTVRALGSLLSLFISVPTLAVFLVIIASLEAHARARGARGLFGWVGTIPWRDPAMAAIAMAVVNLALGGTLAFVLIQEQLARLLSDTFFIPGYFHFLTVGTVSLTLLAAFARIIPAFGAGALRWPRPLIWLPGAVTLGLVIFGFAGISAGLAGMPRRALDVSYDGSAPIAWLKLSVAIGIGAATMAAAMALYALSLIGELIFGRGARATGPAGPSLAAPRGDAIRQAAWAGPISIGVLVAAMYVATTIAFKIMQSLPLHGGGGGH